MDGELELDAMIASLRSLATLSEDAAKLAAPLVLEVNKATAKAGTTPEGVPWKDKQDGGRPLVNAADHISAKAVGPVVVISLKGVDVVHHVGGRNPKRQIIPAGGGKLPAKFAASVTKAAKTAFDAAVKP